MRDLLDLLSRLKLLLLFIKQYERRIIKLQNVKI